MISKMRLVIGTIGLGLVIALSPAAHASSWHVSVEDDLFSETGKKALLFSPNANNPLIFHCDSSGLSFALLERSLHKQDEPSHWSTPVKLIIKVDDEAPLHFSATLQRRNESYVHILAESTDLTLTALQQIKNAKSKVLAGAAFPDDSNLSTSFRATGSTAATNSFMKACGISN